MEERIVIAVDGLAGSGKTTISRELAARLGYRCFYSGGLYRTLAWAVLNDGADPGSEEQVLHSLEAHELVFKPTDTRGGYVALDGQDLGDQIAAPRVSEATSLLSKHPKVRALLIESQRTVFPGENLVAEGRDMGTVVFPDSPLKFFIVAREEVRLSRRSSQLAGTQAGTSDPASLLGKEIVERDQRDTQRAVAPAKPAADAVLIDNSSRSLDEVLVEMLGHVEERGISSVGA